MNKKKRLLLEEKLSAGRPTDEVAGENTHLIRPRSARPPSPQGEGFGLSRRRTPVFRAVCCILLLLLLCGCSRDMNWVISNEPSVRGIVEAIGEETVTLRITESDDPALGVGDVILAEKATRLNDCKFSANIGDEVAVYYDGGTPAEPGAAPAIRNVHGYCLMTPVNREGTE